MQISEKNKKILNKILAIFSWIVTGFAVFMVIFTVFTVSTVDKNERNIFGYGFYIVTSDSMSKSGANAHMDVHFNAGDIIIVEKLTLEEARNLKKGDIITFISFNDDDSYGKNVSHMIMSLNYDKSGRFIGYTTYGTNKGTPDGKMVEPESILGKYCGQLPILGHIFAFVKTTPGYILCILLPFVILIMYNGIQCVALFRRYKKEQVADIEAERAEIAAEREQNAEMMRELLALKEQLAKTMGTSAPSGSDSEPSSVKSQTAPETDGEDVSEPLTDTDSDTSESITVSQEHGEQSFCSDETSPE